MVLFLHFLIFPLSRYSLLPSLGGDALSSAGVPTAPLVTRDMVLPLTKAPDVSCPCCEGTARRPHLRHARGDNLFPPLCRGPAGQGERGEHHWQNLLAGHRPDPEQVSPLPGGLARGWEQHGAGQSPGGDVEGTRHSRPHPCPSWGRRRCRRDPAARGLAPGGRRPPAVPLLTPRPLSPQ